MAAKRKFDSEALQYTYDRFMRAIPSRRTIMSRRFSTRRLHP